MRLAISHRTTYTFDEPVVAALQQIRLTPRTSSTQRVDAWTTSVHGGQVEVVYEDQHGNLVELVRTDPGGVQLTIDSAGEVETHNDGPAVLLHEEKTPLWLFGRSTPLTAPGDAVRDLASDFDADAMRDVAAVHALSAAVLSAMEYRIGSTTVLVTAEDALLAGVGVCQDHAHVFIASARLLGLPARYVSGYLMLNDRVEQDATHAWAEAWIEGLGWVGFDVSNGISPDERYVRTAGGLDYRDAAPVTGVRRGTGGEVLNVTLQVQQ